MKIIRGEQEIELTRRELLDAYYEQQYEFDKEDIRTLLDSFDDRYWQDRYGVCRAEIEPLVEDMAVMMRLNMDKYDMYFDYARDDAVDTVLRRYKKEMEK